MNPQENQEPSNVYQSQLPQPMKSNNKRKFALVSLIVLALLVVVGGTSYYLGSQKSNDKNNSESTTSNVSDQKDDSSDIEYVEFKELGIKAPKDSLKDLEYEIVKEETSSEIRKSAYLIRFSSNILQSSAERCRKDKDNNYGYVSVYLERSGDYSVKNFNDDTGVYVYQRDKPVLCDGAIVSDSMDISNNSNAEAVNLYTNLVVGQLTGAFALAEQID